MKALNRLMTDGLPSRLYCAFISCLFIIQAAVQVVVVVFQPVS